MPSCYIKNPQDSKGKKQEGVRGKWIFLLGDPPSLKKSSRPSEEKRVAGPQNKKKRLDP